MPPAGWARRSLALTGSCSSLRCAPGAPPASRSDFCPFSPPLHRCTPWFYFLDEDRQLTGWWGQRRLHLVAATSAEGAAADECRRRKAA